MKIAIHHRAGSYSEQWIIYCQQHNIQYKIVNAYDNNIIQQLDDCDVFMWHHHLLQYKDYLFAKQLIYVIEKQTSIIVYPNFDTCWHYDDKVGQKYLLDSISAPLIPTYIFYTRDKALEWIQHATFPKVFKLRSGSSSNNVRLAKNATEARKYIEKAFSRGFQKNSHIIRVAQRWKQYRNRNCTFKWFLKGIVTPYSYNERFRKEEIGYIYFQDFIPNNDFVIRVFVIGNRAMAKKTMNRKNDFRASGSGNLIFDKNAIDIRFVKTAFDINQKLKMQSVAFDFLLNPDGNILISEISYCCGFELNKDFPGYWTEDLQWHDCSSINICNFIIEDVIAKNTIS